MSAAVETWLITRRRQIVALRCVEASALILAGILGGRVYSIANPPPEPKQWWSLQIQGDGAVRGPLTMLGNKGQTLLRLEAGASLVREGDGLRLIGSGMDLSTYQILPQDDPSQPPARGRDGHTGDPS